MPPTPSICFTYQTGETTSECYAVQGPRHPTLGIAMDMGIVLKVPSGAILNAVAVVQQ